MGNISIPEIARDFIINILNIIILFVIVKQLVYKPVKKFLEDRSDRLQAQKEEVEKRLQEAEEKNALLEQELGGLEAKGEEIVKAAEVLADENARRITLAARASAEEILKEAKTLAAREKEQMLTSAQESIVNLAFSISDKILKREISDADNKAIAESFFEQMQGKSL